MIRKLFDDPLLVQRFERGRASRAGRSGQRVVQLWQHDLFGNYTYTNPIRFEGTREVLAPGSPESDRMGDIASHHVNLGVQHRWRNFDLGAV